MSFENENSENKWTMNFGYWNCAKGFGGKMGVFRELMQTNNLNVFFISESDMNETMDFSLFTAPGYQLENAKTLQMFKKCRISAFVDTNINAIRRFDLENDGNEIIVLEIKEIDMLVCGLYRPFKINENDDRSLADKFESLIENLKLLNEQGKSIIIMGDFNVNYLEIGNASYRLNNLMTKLSDWANESNMAQIVQNPTRRRLVQLNIHTRFEEALLDHIYTNASLKIVDVCQITNFISDHDALICKVETKPEQRDVKTSFRFRDWSKYSKEKLQLYLSTVNWTLNIPQTGQTLCNWLDRTLITILDKIAPMRTCRIRKPEHFVSLKIERWKRSRKRAFEKFKLTKNNQLLVECKALTKKIKRASKEERIKLIRGGKEGIKDGKSFWQAVNRAKGGFHEPLPNMKYKEQIASTDQEKADLISEFFQEKLDQHQTKDKKDDSVGHGRRIEDLREFENEKIVFDEEEVLEVLRNLGGKKCSGFDNLPMIIYKDGADQLKTVVTELFNLVVTEVKVPEQWRVGRILPLHKKGNKNDVTNYRPISNLCFIGKIYEKCILLYIWRLETKCGTDLTGDPNGLIHKNSGQYPRRKKRT
jgi:sarcosine oxidase/L-pipecolate oxidase